MKTRGVDFVLYNVSDLKRSIAFYRDVLGLPMIGDPGDTWAEFDAGNVTIDIGTFSFDPKAKGGNASVALSVDDVKASVDELRAQGVKILYEMYETPVCFGAAIADPDGNRIDLHHRKDGTSGQPEYCQK